MATANADIKKVLAEYRQVASAFTKAEKRKAELKAVILEEIEVRGIPKVKGEKSDSRTMDVDGLSAVVTSYDRDSISLEETIREFGEDLLKAKKLINTFPVESLKVVVTKAPK
ncbi:Uncharacterised protein [uncultured archaeon]|nr:Uncharacterised protein [uncultured archaeon]